MFQVTAMVMSKEQSTVHDCSGCTCNGQTSTVNKGGSNLSDVVHNIGLATEGFSAFAMATTRVLRSRLHELNG